MDQAQTVPDLSGPGVVDAYKNAAEVANQVMLHLLQNVKPGVTILEACIHADKMIMELCETRYTKLKSPNKGIAFPTCISKNNCVGHYSPIPEDTQEILNEGDMIKIDLGVHFNGFISQCAHTMIVGQNTATTAPIQGRMADVICACHFATECAVRLLRPGNTNNDVTRAIKAVADIFQCSPVEGVLSHRLKKNIIDANEVIINKSDPDQNVDEFQFAANEAYCIDIVMSTGKGKPRPGETRTTVFKRALDKNYMLKSQASRQIFNEIVKDHPILPFSMRALDEKKRRLGLVEIVKYNLLDVYSVLYERDGEYVAQFKFTALILPNSTQKLNSFPLPFVSSLYTVEANPEVSALIASPLPTKNTKKPKKEGASGGMDVDN